PGALNSPQTLTVVTNIRDRNELPLPYPNPAGLFFNTPAGTNPPSQPIRIFTSSQAPVRFQASAVTDDGVGWLSVTPPTGLTSTQNTGQVNAVVNAASLRPGVYSGDVNLAVGGTIRTTNITLVVQPTAGSSPESKNRSAAGCTPSRMSITATGLVNNFATPA